MEQPKYNLPIVLLLAYKLDSNFLISSRIVVLLILFCWKQQKYHSEVCFPQEISHRLQKWISIQCEAIEQKSHAISKTSPNFGIISNVLTNAIENAIESYEEKHVINFIRRIDHIETKTFSNLLESDSNERQCGLLMKKLSTTFFIFGLAFLYIISSEHNISTEKAQKKFNTNCKWNERYTSAHTLIQTSIAHTQ